MSRRMGLVGVVATLVLMPARMFGQGGVADTIQADSVARRAPVSTTGELLNGRVPGLWTHYSTVQGRGASALLLGQEPLVIVDGVRFENSASLAALLNGGPTAGSESDLDPNSIETVEFVPGVSASARYGPDAANGVLVFTTRRGPAGPLRWNAHARVLALSVPKWDLPRTYWGWNTTNPALNCTLEAVRLALCVQDSVTVFPNEFDNPAYSQLHATLAQSLGGNLSGGEGPVRYFLGAELFRTKSPTRIPPGVEDELAAVSGMPALPDDLSGPAGLTRINLHGNISARVAPNADLTVDAGYARNRSDSPLLLILGATTPDHPYYPDLALSSFGSSTTHGDRFFGAATLAWFPASWLRTHATLGHSIGNRDLNSVIRRQNDLIFNSGFVTTDDVRDRATTAELGAAATARAGRLSSRTAVVGQYVRQTNDADSRAAAEMGSTTSTSFLHGKSSQRGALVSETIGLNDRLFVTGGLRFDRFTWMDIDLDGTTQPQGGVSWLVSDEPFMAALLGGGQVTLRYAYGVARRPTAQVIPGVPPETFLVPGFERVREHEFGFDASAWHDRVQLGATWYLRRTLNDVQSTSLSAFDGVRDRQHGFELSLGARVAETDAFSWDVALLHTVRKSKVLDLGAASERLSVEGGLAEGYAVGARFTRHIEGYSDVNGDGAITVDEIQMTDPAYAGESVPPRTDVVSTTLGLFGRRLRVSAQVERRTGFTWLDYDLGVSCRTARCQGAVDPSAPLNARVQALAFNGDASFGIVRSGDFTRLRELSVSLDLPAKIAHALLARSATITVGGRNIAMLEGDLLADDAPYFSVPQVRAWTVRLDLDR